MPSTTEILDGLSAIANQATGIAAVWHLVIAIALIALASGWRPSQHTARLLIGTPLVSVAALAFALATRSMAGSSPRVCWPSQGWR